MLKSGLDSRGFIWGLLSLPAILFSLTAINGVVDEQSRPATEFLLHPTGEFSARFMIIAMILTPMRMLFPNSAFWRWMMKRRRYFGVAAFGYAALHTLFYLLDMGSLHAVLGEVFLIGIWTGWLAMIIFVPLAITSHDWFVRKMGSSWKTLQRFVYVAAVGTLLHWMFVHNDIGPALVHFVPLAGLEMYRIMKNRTRANLHVLKKGEGI